MSIGRGDRLPEATFRVLGSEGIEKLSTSDVFAGKKVVLFAVPGAFTPTAISSIFRAFSTTPTPSRRRASIQWLASR